MHRKPSVRTPHRGAEKCGGAAFFEKNFVRRKAEYPLFFPTKWMFLAYNLTKGTILHII